MCIFLFYIVASYVWLNAAILIFTSWTFQAYKLEEFGVVLELNEGLNYADFSP